MYILFVYIKGFLLWRLTISDLFGQSVLSLYTLIDGKSLSYAYSNREMPDEIRDFQILFRSMLISYIEKHDDVSKKFLDLCVNHIQDISNESFDFLKNVLDYKANFQIWNNI